MIKRCLSYVLIALVASQSVLAYAGNHETRVDAPSIEFHSHSDEGVAEHSAVSANESEEEHAGHAGSADSCAHCTHCHNVPLLHSIAPVASLSHRRLQNPVAHDSAPVGPPTVFYRPPKV